MGNKKDRNGKRGLRGRGFDEPKFFYLPYINKRHKLSGRAKELNIVGLNE